MKLKTKVVTPREIVEIERKRISNKPNEDGYKEWLGNRTYPLDWMKERFGETLTEKDGFTYMSGTRFDDLDCGICNKQTDKDEKVIQLIDDETKDRYYICKTCLRLLGEIL